METLIFIVQVILFVAIIFLINAVNKAPETLGNLYLEQYKSKKASELQIDSYFRDISGKDLQSLFSDWLDLCINTENKVNNLNRKKNYFDLIKKTVLFGSKKTIKICSVMQEFIYSHNDLNDDCNKLILTIYIFELVASLKNDFTGENISANDLLRLRISDYKEIEQNASYRQARAFADEQLKNVMKE